jgi:hypothetical protein
LNEGPLFNMDNDNNDILDIIGKGYNNKDQDDYNTDNNENTEVCSLNSKLVSISKIKLVIVCHFFKGN